MLDNSARNALTLFLVIVLLVAPLHAVASAPASGETNRDAAVTTEEAFGLYATTFDTIVGTVTLNLPDDLAEGDTISGSVFAKPKGNSQSELARHEGELSGYVVELNKDQLSVGERYTRLVVPALSFLPLVLRDKRGKEIARGQISIKRKRAIDGSRRQEEFKTPSVVQAGKPLEVKGAFDGDWKTSAITIAGKAAKILAESPRKVVSQSPVDAIGSTEIEVKEQDQIVARCIYRSIGIKLSAEKLNLTRGEQALMNVTLLGVDGLQAPTTVRLVNKTPAIVRMEGGDSQEFIVDPRQIQGDTYRTTRVLTGLQQGGFSVNAVVDGIQDTKGDCEPLARGRPGTWPTMPLGGPRRPQPTQPDPRATSPNPTEVTKAPGRNGGDIWITGMEITQAIQTYVDGDPSSSNQIPLIGYKTTLVRVYVQSREDRLGPWRNVTGRMTVRNIRGSNLSRPISTRTALNISGRGGQIEARPGGSNRNSTDDSLMFLLDYDQCAPGERELEVEISTLSNREETDTSNNRLTQRAIFSTPLYFSVYGYTYANSNTPARCMGVGSCPSTTRDGSRPPFTDFDAHRLYMENVFPVSQTWVEPIPGYDIRLSFDNSTCEAYLEAHDWLACQVDLLHPAGSLRARAYLLTPENGGYCGICCPGSTVNLIGRGQNFPGGPGFTYAHELAHSWGRGHTPEVGSFLDENYPRADGTVGDQIGIRYDDGTIRLVPPVNPSGRRLGDLMSYTHPTWVSTYTYCGLLNAFTGGRLTCSSQATRAGIPDQQRFNENSVAGILSPPAIQEYLIASLSPPDLSGLPAINQRLFLYVAGQLRPDGTAQFEPFEMIHSPEDIASKMQGGRYRMMFEAKNGKVLSEHRFDPPQNYEPEKKAPNRFSMFIPYDGATARITLREGDRVLAERVVSATYPELKLIAMKGAGALTGKNMLSWQASDRDGDALTFSVYYSRDGGNRWLPLDSGLKQSSIAVNFDNLPGSDNAMIRVVASDGVNCTEARSSTAFRVPRKKPQITLSPANHKTPNSGSQPALIRGTAFDWEDGPIRDMAVYRWRSDRDGDIGNGAWINTTGLSPGRHTITLTVTDSEGSSATASTAVTVVNRGHDRSSPQLPLVNPGFDTTPRNSTNNSSVVSADPRGTLSSAATEAVSSSNNLLMSPGRRMTVTAGQAHTLLILSDASLWAWGDNSTGQLGIAAGTDERLPAQVRMLSSMRAVAGGSRHSLALKGDGTVWAWGDNRLGQLGISGYLDRPPTQLRGLSNIAAIAAGVHHSLAVKSDGTLWAWGYNIRGQLGFETSDSQAYEPRQVPGVTNVSAAAGGDSHSLILLDDGRVWTSGLNTDGVLGLPSRDLFDRRRFAAVPDLVNVAAIASGANFCLALKGDGTVWAWGSNNNGQLGTRYGVYHSGPAPVQGLSGVVAIAVGISHCLALKFDGTVWVWGGNESGQLGNGTIRNSFVPLRMSELTNITSIAAGGSHSIAIARDGSIWTWGSNRASQLGDGTVFDQHRPVRVRFVR